MPSVFNFLVVFALYLSFCAEAFFNTMTPPLPAMQGTLFTYFRDDYVNRVAFLSGNHRKHVVLIGGLGDGLLPVPYTQELAKSLDKQGWSLVQVLLSSSYTGFGHHTLKDDAEELDKLIEFLISTQASEAIGFVGHSTGCQDSVFFSLRGKQRNQLKFMILQAPVSDRESMHMSSPTFQQDLDLAKKMKAEGNEQELMPRKAFWAPITAQRFFDLADKEGLDDFFSSDLLDQELEKKLGDIDIPTLFLFSGADEYVPPHVDVPLLAQRMVRALKSDLVKRAQIVPEACHSSRGHEKVIVEHIIRFINEAMTIT